MSGDLVRSSSRTRIGAIAAAIAVLAVAAIGFALALVPTPSTGGTHRTLPSAAARSRGLGSLPAALQADVSRRLGHDARRYWISGPPRRLRAAGAGLGIRFSRAGVSVGTRRGRLALSLDGIGRGRLLARVPVAVPARGARNAVHYRRRGIDEWYVNGPAGLEQGFTLSRRPAGTPVARGSAPLTLALGIGGDLRATLDRGARSATLRDSHGDAVLSYRGLTVRDRTGSPVPAHLALSGARLSIAIDDRAAAYPLTVDPFVQQAGLTVSTGAAGDALGWSVAMTTDAVAVGAPVVGSGTGAVYVYARGSGWGDTSTPTATLTAGVGVSGDLFGTSVAIQNDTIVVGAPGANGSRGAAYVFVRPGATWSTTSSPTATLSDAAGHADDQLGTSVAIDGTTIVAGAPYADLGAATNAGQADAFVKPTSGWTATTSQTARLTSSAPASNDDLGTSVAVSGDTIVAGAPQVDVTAGLPYPSVGTTGGKVGLFVQPFAGWNSKTQDTWLTIPSTGVVLSGHHPGEDQFGTAVAMSGDTIVGGAPEQFSNGNPGSAWVFYRPDGRPPFPATTAPAAHLTTSVTSDEQQTGASVAIDGSTIVLGAPGHPNPALAATGNQYVYLEPATGWQDHPANEDELILPGGSGASDANGHGSAVAGPFVAGGAPGFNVGGTHDKQGRAVVWQTPAPGTPGPASTTLVGQATGTTQATIAGTLSIFGGTLTDCHFDYGPTRAYGSTAACSPMGGTDVNTQANLTGLTPGTIYHYRISVTTVTGTHMGADMTFRTLDAPPVNTGAPTLSGEAQQGQTLTESHGHWTNSPTSYSYTWQACDRSGANCTVIAGATAQRYTLTGSDTGHTIRVQERATSVGGTSAPARSAASAVVTAAPPVNGKTVIVGKVSGTVTIALPGRRPTVLQANQAIPVGATIDATRGRVRLTAAKATGRKTQTADFYGGAFIVGQARHQTVTTLKLTGGARCVVGKAAAIARRRPRRKLFGSGHGSFTTVGNSASASVRGTIWETLDYCDGSTLVAVTRGTVSVRDFVRKRTLLVHAGHSYLAVKR